MANPAFGRLKIVLDELVMEYDVILVDNMPSINVLTDNTVVASDRVLSPTYRFRLSRFGSVFG